MVQKIWARAVKKCYSSREPLQYTILTLFFRTFRGLSRKTGIDTGLMWQTWWNNESVKTHKMFDDKVEKVRQYFNWYLPISENKYIYIYKSELKPCQETLHQTTCLPTRLTARYDGGYCLLLGLSCAMSIETRFTLTAFLNRIHIIF